METKEAVTQRLASNTANTLLTEMMGVLGHSGRGRWSRLKEWTLMAVAIDSGAAETLIPHTLVTDYLICATAKSEAGACYSSATGEPIPNLADRRLPMSTLEGSLRAMTFQAAPVAKPPLGSVMRI